MKKVESAMKYYNANTRDNRVGDCVKRAISLGLGMTYDEVSAKLNAIKRKLNLSAYNDNRVFSALLSSLGYSRIRISGPDYPSLTEFAEAHPTGTYILGVTDKNPERGCNHMVTIINGDIYDSWDSHRTTVLFYYEITHDPVSMPEEVDISEYIDAINEGVDVYLKKLNAKNKWGEFFLLGTTRYNKYTAEVQVKVKFNDYAVSVDTTLEYGNRTMRKDITAKISPRGVDDAGLAQLIKSINQRIYDWWWMIADDLKGAEYAKTAEHNPTLYSGDVAKLRKLPEWVRPLVTYMELGDGRKYGGGYNYYLEIKALPDDPRAARTGGGSVTFYADTMAELKEDLEDYHTSFKRFGYDY